MENKTSIFKRFHAAIRTQHVFIEGEQVFFKKSTDELFLEDTKNEEWFPIEFQWIPVKH
jgi:hypothetical protein